MSELKTDKNEVTKIKGSETVHFYNLKTLTGDNIKHDLVLAHTLQARVKELKGLLVRIEPYKSRLPTSIEIELEALTPPQEESK